MSTHTYGVEEGISEMKRRILGAAAVLGLVMAAAVQVAPAHAAVFRCLSFDQYICATVTAYPAGERARVAASASGRGTCGNAD